MIETQKKIKWEESNIGKTEVRYMELILWTNMLRINSETYRDAESLATVGPSRPTVSKMG